MPLPIIMTSYPFFAFSSVYRSFKRPRRGFPVGNFLNGNDNGENASNANIIKKTIE